ncbi:MAG: YicC family protein [Treponema sp.]|nr:YicC family protein [Treponema sp.]
MISMTGFAWREWAGDDVSISVEIKGYNNRFLEVYVNLPPWLSYMEPKVRELISCFCGRGKVEVSIRLRELNAPLNVTVNTNAAGAYMQAISALASDLGIDAQLSVSQLIGMEGVLDIEKNRDEQRHWNMIEPVLRDAACAFQAEREREGKHTEEDILESICNIESALQTITAHIPHIEISIKENIKTRFKELVGDSAAHGGVVIDDNRILAETAMLLMKYTISEEVSRLSSHLAEFRAETAKNQQSGKKLDFLCQEINREINTIGSKNAMVEVSRAVVKMKEALENVREQLRNVE